MNVIRLDYEVIRSRMEEVLALEEGVYQAFGKQYDTSAWSAKEFIHVLPKKEELSLAVEIDGLLKGFSIAYQFEPGSCHISRVAIDPQLTGKGLGHEMLTEQLVNMRDLQADFCTIDLTLANQGAKRFYERLGFTRIEGEQLKAYVLRKNRSEQEYLGNTPSHCAMQITLEYVRIQLIPTSLHRYVYHCRDR